MPARTGNALEHLKHVARFLGKSRRTVGLSIDKTCQSLSTASVTQIGQVACSHGSPLRAHVLALGGTVCS
eukprot:9348193-Karenia_brevis.AAC.1